jgi:Na+/H+-translocating membrane pyrophosphatase
MSLASLLLVGGWPWSAAAIVVAVVAMAAAASRHLSLAARSDGDDAARADAAARRAELHAALGAGGRALAAVAGALLVAWLALASSPGARGAAWAFAVGVLAAAVVVVATAALEHSARTRAAVAARSDAPLAAAIAWEGGVAATLVVGVAQIVATGIVGATTAEPTDGTGGSLGLAAGVLLVAWFAQSARAFAPAMARCAALLSVQTFALAAAALTSAHVASADARPDLFQVSRLLVALGALAPLATPASSGGGTMSDGRPLARRIAAPLAALLAAGLLCALFVGPVAAVANAPAGGFSALAATLVAAIALVAIVARVAEHSARTRADEAAAAAATGASRDALATATPSLFVPGLVVAAALVVAASAGGAWGIGLAAAAAAAALPSCVAAGFAAELLPLPPADAERSASTATVALAGWAMVAVARGGDARLDLLSADVAAGAIVGVALVLFATATWRRGESSENSNSTRAALRAMIAPALLAVAAPVCVARLNPAAGGGMTAGALLGGATAAFLVARTTAVLFDRVVSLICITIVLCSK